MTCRNRKPKKNINVEEFSPRTVIRERRRELRYKKEIRSFFLRTVILLVSIWILFGMFFGITVMKNDDMSPRISAGDLLFYYRLENRFSAGDVVVFQKSGKEYVGRIVAKGGDKVEITNRSELKVNDGVVLEDDIYYSTPQYDSDVTYPLILSEEEYFILCDYREQAEDSRYFGAVAGEAIQGKVLAVIRRSEL